MPRPATPEPDTKDWTWVLTRPCPECGFDPADVGRDVLPMLIRHPVSRWSHVLRRPTVGDRPAPTTWSPLEYACHVRDVCRLIDERARLLLAEDDPAFDSWDQDAAALEKQYWRQSPERVRAELQSAAESAAATFAGVGGRAWRRPGRRSDGFRFTVETLGVNLVHELIHHLWDVDG